jgi:hypothetical protein
VHYTTSCNTQPSAPEDEQNNCPKHVELNGIINKPLLWHLVGCLGNFYLISYKFSQIEGKKLAEFVRVFGDEGNFGSERKELRASRSTAHDEQHNDS